MSATTTTLQKGFTLVELVIVIVLLSALSIMTTSYISTGVDIYTDIADRDKSLNSIRFVMERLRREVTNALPNSAIVSDSDSGSVTDGCLAFTPIVTSSVYTDFPISPDSGDTGIISPISDYEWSDGDKAVVYLLDSDDLDNTDKVNAISGINTDKDTLTFSTSPVSFSLASPAKRVYIINNDVSYCFSHNNIYRSENDDVVLMAENITGSFTVDKATLYRNSLVQATYELDFDGQEVPVEQTLHISNTP